MLEQIPKSSRLSAYLGKLHVDFLAKSSMGLCMASEDEIDTAKVGISRKRTLALTYLNDNNWVANGMAGFGPRTWLSRRSGEQSGVTAKRLADSLRQLRSKFSARCTS